MIEPHDPIPFKTPSRHERVMRDSSGWKPTAYRSHTIGDVTSGGAGMLGEEVTISGYAETVRGRGAICFLMLRDGTGKIQAFLKRDNMDESIFDAVQSATRESTIQVNGIVAQKLSLIHI